MEFKKTTSVLPDFEASLLRFHQFASMQLETEVCRRSEETERPAEYPVGI